MERKSGAEAAWAGSGEKSGNSSEDNGLRVRHVILARLRRCVLSCIYILNIGGLHMAWPTKQERELKGHENLTMADQMRAMSVPGKLTTSPVTGAVENQRRKYMENMIKARNAKAAGTGHSSKKGC